MNAFLKTHLKLASFSHRFFMKFHDFLGIDFGIDLFIDFWWKRLPKCSHFILTWSQKAHGAESFLAPFSRPCLLCWFYVEFGSLWAPFWLPLAHFWLPFGSLWLPFGSLLVSLGSLLVPFASLLLTRGSIFSLLLYPVLIFGVFWEFPRKYHTKFYF